MGEREKEQKKETSRDFYIKSSIVNAPLIVQSSIPSTSFPPPSPLPSPPLTETLPTAARDSRAFPPERESASTRPPTDERETDWVCDWVCEPVGRGARGGGA